MTKLELLNVFLNERLTAAADEIFRAVKDTIVEYQSEILRSKEENERLNRLLNIAVQRLLLHPEPQSIQPQEDEQSADPQLCEQDWASGLGAEDLEPPEPPPPPPHIKEEPELRIIDKEERRPACEFDTDAACLGSPSYADGACGQVDHPQRSHLHPAHTDGERVSPPPPRAAPMDIKVEHDYSNYRGAPHDSADVNRIQRRERAPVECQSQQQQQQQQQQQSKVPQSHAGGKQSSAHILRLKNAKASRAAQAAARPAHQAVQGLQKWHYCRECGKSFSFACQLEVHMRWHTKEKPYGCAVCRKSFTTVSMLKRHHRIHTGEKPFRCSVCGKCFNQSAHLNTHFRLHTGERDRWTRAPHPSPK